MSSNQTQGTQDPGYHTLVMTSTIVEADDLDWRSFSYSLLIIYKYTVI
jgi:hypothetical protein